MTDVTFPSMGTEVRLLIDGEADATAGEHREFLVRFEAALSRFRPDSELCRFNADPAPDVAASPLLCSAAAAGRWAAERTDGLVDFTLVDELEAAGYDRSRSGPELALAAALTEAPARAAAHPHLAARWRHVHVDAARGAIRRPPGIRLDTGGTGKGLAADMIARRLGTRAARWAIDCGGDLRASAPAGDPFPVDVAHPLGGTAHRLWLAEGAVASSGLNVRLWRRPDGSPAHHLLDPLTGEPVWSGLVGATALAPTALEAEVLAKAALLSGPAGAHRWLRRHGGLTVRDDGEVQLHGALRPRPVVRVSLRGSTPVLAGERA